MIYHSVTELNGRFTLTIRRLAIVAVVCSLLPMASGVAPGQTSEITTQPPDGPEPRFPQLPGDDPDSPIVEAQDDVKVIARPGPNEMIGRLKSVDGRKIKFRKQDEEKTKSVQLAPDAKVTLNRKPAKLSDLKAHDFVRLTTSPDADGMAVKVAAARVVEDTPPQPDPKDAPPARTRTRNADADLNSGLGIVFSDSPNQGVLILDVHQETPAWSTKIRSGDYLMAVDNNRITTPDDFFTSLKQHEPGNVVRLTIWRNGKLRENRVELTTRNVADDRVAKDSRALILAETHGDDTVVIRRKPKTEALDRGPEQSQVLVESDPDGEKIVVEKQTQSESPKDHDDLARKYRELQDRVSALEEQLDRIQK